uniref:Secreted protein n=1 Tax=Ixodes ricinus TaxID=34613 RepID=A0A6B0V3Y7_IXORI
MLVCPLHVLVAMRAPRAVADDSGQSRFRDGQAKGEGEHLETRAALDQQGKCLVVQLQTVQLQGDQAAQAAPPEQRPQAPCRQLGTPAQLQPPEGSQLLDGGETGIGEVLCVAHGEGLEAAAAAQGPKGGVRQLLSVQLQADQPRSQVLGQTTHGPVGDPGDAVGVEQHEPGRAPGQRQEPVVGDLAAVRHVYTQQPSQRAERFDGRVVHALAPLHVQMR